MRWRDDIQRYAGRNGPLKTDSTGDNWKGLLSGGDEDGLIGGGVDSFNVKISSLTFSTNSQNSNNF